MVVVLFPSSVVTRATPVFFCPRTKGRVHPCAFRAAPLRVSLLPPGTPLSTASARVYARVSHPPAPPPRKFTAVLEQSYDDRRAFSPPRTPPRAILTTPRPSFVLARNTTPPSGVNLGDCGVVSIQGAKADSDAFLTGLIAQEQSEKSGGGGGSQEEAETNGAAAAKPGGGGKGGAEGAQPMELEGSGVTGDAAASTAVPEGGALVSAGRRLFLLQSVIFVHCCGPWGFQQGTVTAVEKRFRSTSWRDELRTSFGLQRMYNEMTGGGENSDRAVMR